MRNREPCLVLRVLGTTRLDDQGEPKSIPSVRQRRILAVLAAAGGQPVSTDLLVDALWGETLPAHPEAALQTQLTRVRHALGDFHTALVSGAGSYRLDLRRCQVDAWWFEDVAAECGAAGGPDRLRVALSWWEGRAFADAADHPGVQPAAVRLDELRGQAIETLAEMEFNAGRPDACLQLIQPLVAEDTFRERAHAILLRSLHAAGRGNEALQRFQQHRRRLVDELGLDPSPELVQIEHDILEHRLPTAKGLVARESQLPPLPVSSFIGRDDELQSVTRLVQEARIVTIVGSGGAGKTRLALHAAHNLRNGYPDGVWWCDLLSVTPGLAAAAVAARLGLQERAGQHALERLGAYLSDRSSLLVLDNCEHLSSEVRAIVEAIVQRGTRVDVIATSRQPLYVDGEHRVRLSPLAHLAGDAISTPAIDLFLDRARAAAPGFRADGEVLRDIAELCGQLGGLPLAIELAAACVTRIDVHTLAVRICEQPRLLDQPDSTDRHHSLAAVVEASYLLLATSERRLVDRLTAFAGPFTLAQAEQLDQLGGETTEMAVTLGALVDKSLVLFRPDDGRFELLPPVHAVCRVHVRAAGQLDQLRRHHTQVVLDEAARIDRTLQGPDEVLVASAFDDIIAELRVARAWLDAAGEEHGLVTLSAATHWFSLLRTRSELYRWAEDTVASESASTRHPRADRVWACAANGAAKRGDLARASAIAERGVELLGHEARCLVETLSQIRLFEGKLDAAVAASRTATERHVAAGDSHRAISSASVEAAALAYQGDRRNAEALARRLDREASVLGVTSLQAMTSYILAETIQDSVSSAAMYQRALDLATESRADFVTGLAMTSLAALELRTGRRELARARLGEAIEHWERGGIWNQQWVAIRLLVDALDGDDEYEPVATLVGVYDTSPVAGPAYGDDARRLTHHIERARKQLGDDRYDSAYQHGTTLTDAQTLRLARSLARRSPT